jgi:hypothetical protein
VEALSAETSLPLIYALSSALRAPNHPTRRLIAVILMIMKKARDLALRRSCLREVGEGSRVIEELPLDFGRESTPSHDDGRSQTFPDFLVLVERLTNLQNCRRLGHSLGVYVFRYPYARIASSRHKSAALVVPSLNGNRVAAYISLMVFF